MSRTLTRRSFVTATAWGLGLLATPAARPGPESPPRRKFTLALSCDAAGVAASPREAIDLAARFGFEAVEPSIAFLQGLSGDETAALLGTLKDLKLVWAASGLPVEFRGAEAAYQDSLKRLPAQAGALQKAGVTRVATWLTPTSRTLTYVSNFRQHARRLREVARVLADHGLRLGLEYVGPKTSWTAGRYPFIHTMAEMKELLAEIGCPNVGFLLDSWHWYTAQETVQDLLSLRGADVVCCHINDAPKGVPVDQQVDNRRDLPAATGVIDLKGFLGTLARIGYDGPVLAEPFRPDLRRMPRDEALALVAESVKKAAALASRI